MGERPRAASRSGHRFLLSGCPFHPHDAQSGVKVYVDIEDQAVRPSGECAKVRHGFCGYGDVAFDLNSHVVAVAKKKLFHILDCVGRVPHVRSPTDRWNTISMSKSVSPQMVLTVVPSAGCLNLCAVFREFVNAAKKLCVPKGSLNRVFIFSLGGCGGPYAAFRMRAFGSLGRFCF